METKFASDIDVIEEVEAPLSKNVIWERQKAFYRDQGIQAWANKIPFYATSNPHIANAYANVVMRFMQDIVRAGTHRRLEPFYIIELGTGSGMFSYYMLKRLIELQEALGMGQVSFVYVMTDFVEANIAFWQVHPALQPYVARGVLDFATYDIGSDHELHLLKSGTVLQKPDGSDTSNPMIVLANYVLDTLPQDLFSIEEGKLKEGLIKRDSDSDSDESGLPELHFTYRDVTFPYYTGDGAEDCDAVLINYARHAGDGNVLFPICSLWAIGRLIELAGGRLLLLSTDKGYSRHFELFRAHEPGMVPHDKSFSMMVNFHAIGQYFRQRGGDFIHQSTQQGIVSSVFTIGQEIIALPETRLAISDWLQSMGPGNLLNLYLYMEKTRPACSLETFIATLSMFREDPHLWDVYSAAIPAMLRSAEAPTISDLMNMLGEIADNFYFIPGGPDTLVNIAVFCQEMREYPMALGYYHRSIMYFGNVDTTLYNMALCHYSLGEYRQARGLFEATVQLNPEYVMARGWLAQLEFEETRRATSDVQPSAPDRSARD